MADDNPKTQDKRTLAQVAKERGPLDTNDAAAIILELLEALSKLHLEGKVHRQICADTVCLEGANSPKLEPAKPQITIGGIGVDYVLCPPQLHNIPPLTLPVEIEAAQQVLTNAGILLHPRQIDFYQLGALLCFMVSSHSVSDYLRSCKAKADVPEAIRPIIDRALGLNSRDRFESSDSFASELEAVISSKPAAKSPTSGLPDSVFVPPVSNVPADTAGASKEALPFKTLGHYEITERIGHGGMGDVYKAYEQALDRVVAIKVLPEGLARQKDFVKRFHAEATAIAKLDHPNIVRIYYSGQDHGHHFFAMQYVDGDSLADLLTRRKKLTAEDALLIIRQCLAGIAAAHKRGLIHRDIKPGNVLLDRHSRRALVTDFGVAKSADAETQLTVTGAIMGTADYIAPEQARGSGVDQRTDLYAMGVLMYQMLSGRLPFDAKSATSMMFQHAYEPPPPLSQVAPDVPPAMAEVVMKLMAKDPGDRYQSADEVLASLENIDSETAKPGSTSQTGIVEIPIFDSPPELPSDLVRFTGKSWFDRLGIRITDFLGLHAPQLVECMQTTNQQVDGAVAEYQRRRDKLAQLAEEANTTAEDLEQQAKAQRNAAAVAGQRAQAAANPTAKHQALTQQQQSEQAAAELAQLGAEQAEQADEIGMRLAKVEAKLAQLRASRDALKARMMAVNARLGATTSTWPPSKRLIGAAIVMMLLCAALLTYVLWPGPQSESVQIGEEEVELLSGGEFKYLKPGVTVSADSSRVWKEISSSLIGAAFLQNPSEYQGVVKFRIKRSGRLQMACTRRWGGGGNAGGEWKEQIISRDELIKAGWKPVDGRLVETLEWELFERFCRSGETFSYRTEKYSAPILILGSPENIQPKTDLAELEQIQGYAGILDFKNNIQAYSNRNYIWKNIPQDFPLKKFAQVPGGSRDPVTAVVGKSGYVYIISLPTDNDILAKDGWDKTQITMNYTDAGFSELVVYKRFIKKGNSLTLTSLNWAGPILLLPDARAVSLVKADTNDLEVQTALTVPEKLTGKFHYVAKGELALYHNGKQISAIEQSSSPELTITPQIQLRQGDIVVVRINSQYVFRSFRMAFVSGAHKWYVPLKRSDFRRVEKQDIASITTDDVANANELPSYGRPDLAFQGVWASVNPPAPESEWIWGPAKNQWFQYAFVVKPSMFKAVAEPSGETPVKPDTPASGLVGHWKFDEGSGAVAHDSVGNNHGTIRGAWWKDGKFGTALYFDGKNDYIDLTELPLGQSFAISFWADPSDLNPKAAQCFIGKHTDPRGDNIFLFGFYEGKFHVRIRDDVHLEASPTTGWQHLVVVVQRIDDLHSNITVYRNGIALWTTTLDAVVGDMSGLPWTVGQDWDGYPKRTDFFNGAIDEVRIYNGTLSAKEIQQLYESQADSYQRSTVQPTGYSYSSDFEGEVGSEWSSRQTDKAPNGAKRFLGRFRNDEKVKLSFGKGSPIWPEGLSKHKNVTIEFDLFIIHSWDGAKFGDKWRLSVEGGPTLLNTSFANCKSFPGNPQSFPETFGGKMFPAQTGAAEINSLGYLNISPKGFGDSIYHLRYTFPHSADSLVFQFEAEGVTSMTHGNTPLRGLADESWGLDNVNVTFIGEDSGRSRWIDMLKLVDPSRDAAAGKWTLAQGNLSVDGTPAARISLPYKPPEEYDFLIEFSVSKDSPCVAQLVSKGQVPFTWSMNAGNPRRCRLEDIDGHSVIGNTTLRAAHPFKPGMKYVSLVKVRKGSVRCLINGELIVEHKTDYGDLTRNQKWSMPDDLRLGLGTWQGPTTFHRIAVREVTGAGELR